MIHVTHHVTSEVVGRTLPSNGRRLRVVICGSGGAGRSTLLTRLSNQTDWILVGESAIESSAQGADTALIVVDACEGLTHRARRDSFLASQFRLRRSVLVVNRMDQVNYSRDVFEALAGEYLDFAARTGSASVACIPVSALLGENVGGRSDRMPWYVGPTLLEQLEADSLMVEVPSSNAQSAVADQFEATLVWLDSRPMLPGRTYLLSTGGRTVPATVARLKYRVNVETLEHAAARTLEHDEIGVCGLDLSQAIPFAPYNEDRALGGFTLLDGDATRVVGTGFLHFALRRSQNVHWQALDVDKRARAELKGQKPCVIWFTGLSGAGKSTIANALEKRLHALGHHTYLLDGDNVRHGLNRDLGFTDADRVENIRRVAEVARLMADAGLIVLVSFISPFRAERRMARDLMEPGEFCEVFVDTPLDVAESRDPKGLYRKARRGELKNFTGVDSPYEIPEAPELRLDTRSRTAEFLANAVLEYLSGSGIVSAVPDSGARKAGSVSKECRTL